MAEEENTQKGDKREAILQAALELIAEHGLQHTPMSLISKRARASAGIIYHYFESKDDLLESLYLRVKGDMSRAWLAADDPQQPLARRFQSLLLVIFRYCIAHPQEVAFLEQYESFPQAKPHDVQFQEKGKTLDGLIEDLRTQDLLKDLPLEVIGEFTLGMALRLARLSAAGVVSLDEATLTDVARACWDAIAR